MRRLLTVTAFTALLTVLRMAAGFAVAKMVALYTGPAGLAMLGNVQNLVGILNGLVTAPVGAGVVRYTAENLNAGHAACAPWWQASLRWSAILLAVVVPSTFIFSDALATWLFGSASNYWLIVLAGALLPVSVVGTFITSVINGQQRYRRYVYLGMASVVISSSVMIFLIYSSNLIGALVAATIQNALIGVVMLVGTVRQPWFKLYLLWGAVDRARLKSIGGYVLMALTTALTGPVSLVLVRNLLVENAGWDAAGQWQAVWKISEAYLAVITLALGTYYLPKLSSLTGVNAIRIEIKRTAMVVMPVIAVMGVLIYSLRDIIIALLFTAEFYSARDLFAVQLVGDFFKILAWLYAYPMISRGATRWFIASEVFFAISFVLFTLIMVRAIGITGVVYSYMVNYFICFVVMFANLSRFAR